MAVRRNKDTGETIDEPTRKLGSAARDPDAAREQTTEPHPARASEARPGPVTGARGRGAGPARPASEDAFEAPTQKVETASRRPAGEDRTRLFRPGAGAADTTPQETRAHDPMADPVTGWLVVVDGPGKGQVCPLGYGSNSLGRGEDARVRLEFGDDHISRGEHATVTYDPRGRKFYLQHGGGKNLTYLDDDPVLSPTTLNPRQAFTIGETTLQFIPFCGPEFDWQDTEGK